jgi:ATP-dependent helicase/nuclease subunit B
MAKALGLPSPEQRLGLSAHDFVQCASQARRAFLTRSEKVDGAPTVPSRWLVRLRTLLSGLKRAELLQADEPWLGWIAARGAPAAISSCKPPEPRPPVASRPRALSVTQIEHYLRDPYAIYARHVLRLKPLPPLDEKPDALQRGIIVHRIFQRFGEQPFEVEAADALERLLALGRAVFDESAVSPAVEALWWPRFVAAARGFIADERAWARSGARIFAVERKGAVSFTAPAGAFTLTSRADRIDRLSDGTLAIFDYKTGHAPSGPQVKSGLAPQLPLEAAIAERGGFEGIPAASVAALGVIRLHARGSERRFFDAPDALARDARAKLEKLIARYDDVATPYLARLRPMFAQRLDGDYDHLSRLKEWSAEGAGEEP